MPDDYSAYWVLTLLPIKTLIHLTEKLPTRENHFPTSVPTVYEKECLNISAFVFF